MPFKDKKTGSEYMKQYYRKNIEARKEQTKKYRLEHPGYERNCYLKRNFNITTKEYDELFIQQNGVCLICFKNETSHHQNGKVKRLAVDHCHETGKVRGLLCNRCNTAIGLLQNNPVLAQKASDYLIKHQNT